MTQEWQTDAFRSSLVRKLEEAIRESGNTTQKNAVDMEKQVFQRAKSKEEYLSFVARLILHVRQQNTGAMQTNDPSINHIAAMQIFVKTLTGKTVTLQVEDSTLVMDVKAKIEEKEGIPIHRQTLVNGNKILEQDETSLSSYNVSNEATLQMILRWNRSDIEVDNNQNQKSKGIGEKEEGGSKYKKDACEKFQDRLVKSLTFEMNREVEKKTVAFKKLEEERIEINRKVSELEGKKDRKKIEFNKRERETRDSHTNLLVEGARALKEKRATDQKILELQNESEKLELLIRHKKTDSKTIWQKHEVDKNQIEREIRKLEQEISKLKRKRSDIEEEKNDLFKKKKVSDGFLEFLSNSIEEKKKDLECPVCFETAFVPIFKCSMDHLICNKCLSKLNICPECRKPYGKSPARNRFAEKQVEEIKKLSTKRNAILDGV